MLFRVCGSVPRFRRFARSVRGSEVMDAMHGSAVAAVNLGFRWVACYCGHWDWSRSVHPHACCPGCSLRAPREKVAEWVAARDAARKVCGGCSLRLTS